MPGALALGTVYSWPQAQFLIGGVPFIGIRKGSFKKKREKKNIKGVGSEPIGRGYGGVDYEGSIDIILDNWKQIIAASPNGDPTQLGPFQIRVPFIPNPNTPNAPTVDVWQNCEFLDDGVTYSEGDTSIWQTVGIIYAGQQR